MKTNAELAREAAEKLGALSGATMNEKIARLRELLANATQREWKFDPTNVGVNSYPGYGIVDANGKPTNITIHMRMAKSFDRSQDNEKAEADAWLIVEAVNALPALLDRIESTELEKLEPLLARFQPCGCQVCVCDSEIQCFGCGAHYCGKPECCLRGTGTPVFKNHPLVERIAELERQLAQAREAYATEYDKVARLDAKIAKLEMMVKARDHEILSLNLECDRHVETERENSAEIRDLDARLTQARALLKG